LKFIQITEEEDYTQIITIEYVSERLRRANNKINPTICTVLVVNIIADLAGGRRWVPFEIARKTFSIVHVTRKNFEGPDIQKRQMLAWIETIQILTLQLQAPVELV
jgi:hypothetical protein